MLNFDTTGHAQRPRLGEIMAPEANSFGVLRLAMASLVLISHSYLYAFGTDKAEPLTAWTGHSLGEHAVQVFFILSGILVAQSLDRSRSLVDFAAARVLRIFPGLIVCVLLTALRARADCCRACHSADYFTNGQLPAYLLKTLSLSTGNAPLPGVFEDAAACQQRQHLAVDAEIRSAVLCGSGYGGRCRAVFKPRLRKRQCALLLAVFLVVVFAAEPKPAETYAFTDNARYFALYFGTGVLAYLIRDKLVIAGAALVPLAVLFVVSTWIALRRIRDRDVARLLRRLGGKLNIRAAARDLQSRRSVVWRLHLCRPDPASADRCRAVAHPLAIARARIRACSAARAAVVGADRASGAAVEPPLAVRRRRQPCPANAHGAGRSLRPVQRLNSFP